MLFRSVAVRIPGSGSQFLHERVGEGDDGSVILRHVTLDEECEELPTGSCLILALGSLWYEEDTRELILAERLCVGEGGSGDGERCSPSHLTSHGGGHAIECHITDGGDIGRDGDGLEVLAEVEGSLAEGLHILGEFKFHQTETVLEGIVTDGLNFMQVKGLQVGGATEGIRSDLLDIVPGDSELRILQTCRTN